PDDSDYSKGIVHRNWSLMGDINQKGLREQDAPVALDELNDEQKALIKQAEQIYGFQVK
ncbi:MAG: DUF3864 domain-containing protein, partial [Clostridia bacterium]|nr:DUF3864 domain-containing protein [Clostridia bacterium]